jgi:hypothetical protein
VRRSLLAVPLASGALAIGLTGVAAAGSAATARQIGAATARHIKCTTVQYAVNRSGSEQLGTVRCGRPFGAGVLQTKSGGKVAGNTVVLFGAFKYYFNLGTFHGTYRLAGTTQSATYTGTARVTGGTGAYRRAAGPAAVTCRSPANSRTTRCTIDFALTRG